ncbi:retinoic acid receptor responder protein 1 [Gracilinanus agilis]|uniref:retinoic acid receptor responder protein 1 n=1 Tax=Gracilinanus agilis TaxID=191870 RepID=UPI001CFEFFE6|nr:retinoic acid receptor responder protein 1 [Gracilinanus agilis]
MLGRSQWLPGWAGPTAVLLVALLPVVAQAFASSWRLLDAAPSSPGVQQAARAALHYFNYRAASPSTLQVLQQVNRASAWINAEKGRRFDLVFTTASYRPESKEKHSGICSALVIFRNHQPKPTVNITCTRLLEDKEKEQEDYQLYKQMKELKKPDEEVRIPDSLGHVEPSLQPLWNLAVIGSSYVMWEKTSQASYYYMTQISGVKQWVTRGDFISFNYTALLHQFSTQDIIPCQIHLIWYPGKPLKVRYRCQDPETQPEGSGNDQGSAETPTEIPSNF